MCLLKKKPKKNGEKEIPVRMAEERPQGEIRNSYTLYTFRHREVARVWYIGCANVDVYDIME